MLSTLLELSTCWEQLQKTNKPVVMYGMGNGADHILRYLDQMGVPVQEFFASDRFVRGHSFHGRRVKKLSEIQAQYEDFVIVTAFAVQDEPTMAAIQRLDQQYELYAPDVPVVGENLFDQTFLAAHLAEVQAVDALWADERSRRIYRDLIAYKLTGKLSYLVPTSSSRQEVFSDLLQLGPKEFYADLGAVADSGRRIEADSLDNLLGKAPLTFLKMDVEGSESRAILGSANAIRRHKPKLMISAYHRSEDLFALPLQIQRIQPGYRFYLRRFPYIPAWEINLIGLWEG